MQDLTVFENIKQKGKVICNPNKHPPREKKTEVFSLPLSNQLYKTDREGKIIAQIQPSKTGSFYFGGLTCSHAGETAISSHLWKLM